MVVCRGRCGLAVAEGTLNSARGDKTGCDGGDKDDGDSRATEHSSHAAVIGFGREKVEALAPTRVASSYLVVAGYASTFNVHVRLC